MIYRRVPYAQEAPVEIVDLPSARRVLERLFANADNQLNAHYASHPENAPSWWSLRISCTRLGGYELAAHVAKSRACAEASDAGCPVE